MTDLELGITLFAFAFGVGYGIAYFTHRPRRDALGRYKSH